MDDFGIFAADGIEDDWQVAYFGEENQNALPDRDPDGDGRDNRFEAVSLTDPTNAASLFSYCARREQTPARGIAVVFSPVRPDRTYTVLYSLDLSPGSWQPLTGVTQIDEGDVRTVIDPAAAGVRKFYRIEIAH